MWKRLICYCLSLSVAISAFTLGVFADDSSNITGYIEVVEDDTNPPSGATIVSGAISDRSFSSSPRFQYTFIRSLTVEIPASSYIYVAFDLVADPYTFNQATGNPVTIQGYCFTTNFIAGPDPSLYTISPSTIRLIDIKATNYYPIPDSYYRFVRFEMVLMNEGESITTTKITFTDPIVITHSLFTENGSTRYNAIGMRRATVKASLDLNGLLAFIDNYYAYWQSQYFEVWDNFLNRIHYAVYGNNSMTWYNFNTNQDGSTSLSTLTGRPFNAINGNLRAIANILYHQDELINKAVEQGANDAYEELNESASFSSLSDFASAGSAASWSSGSFVDGLGETWNWFTNENKQMIDAVQPSRSEVYISIYDSTLEEYKRLLGGD